MTIKNVVELHSKQKWNLMALLLVFNHAVPTIFQLSSKRWRTYSKTNNNYSYLKKFKILQSVQNRH